MKCTTKKKHKIIVICSVNQLVALGFNQEHYVTVDVCALEFNEYKSLQISCNVFVFKKTHITHTHT